MSNQTSNQIVTAARRRRRIPVKNIVNIDTKLWQAWKALGLNPVEESRRLKLKIAMKIAANPNLSLDKDNYL